MTTSTYKSSLASVARLLLGAVLFLVLASYLAIPCLNADPAQFQHVGGMNACTEHHLFKPQADLSHLFDVPMTETFRLVVPIALALPFLLAFALASCEESPPRQRRRRRDAHLPFVTSNPSLPPYAALRDA